MAERVDAFPRKPRGNQKWEFLDDGAVWKLAEEDMEGYKGVKSVTAAIRYYAREKGMRCQVMEHETGVYVQLLPKASEPSDLTARRRAQRRQSG